MCSIVYRHVACKRFRRGRSQEGSPSHLRTSKFQSRVLCLNTLVYVYAFIVFFLQEVFAAKFKTPEIAQEFRDTFNRCVAEIERASADVTPAPESTSRQQQQKEKKTAEEGSDDDDEGTELATKDEDTDDADDDVTSSQDSAAGGVSGGAIGTEKQSLSEMFKMSADEWDSHCGDCYVRNKTDAKQCVACETAKTRLRGGS